MNSVLLYEQDSIGDNRVRLTGRRLAHVLSVHRAEPGDTLKVGMLGGRLGTGTVLSVGPEALEMSVVLDRAPPPPVPAVLIISLPRPKSFRKVVHVATTMGVKQIHFVNSHRVEKSYWSSPKIAAEAVREILVLGLEQAVDTILPEVSFHKRIRWFVEDDLPRIAAGRRGLIAHPAAGVACPRALEEPSVVVIGPEGGLMDYEVRYFADIGFTPVTIGPRVLRVEEAVPAILGRLY